MPSPEKPHRFKVRISRNNANDNPLTFQAITERVHIEKRYGPRRPNASNDDDTDNPAQGSGNNSHTPPPPYSSMPFSSPPPRYVSVIGLNDQPVQHNKKKKSRPSKSSHPPVPKVAPAQSSLSNSSFVEEDGDSGLPSYDEALNIEQEGGARISMV